MASAEIFLNAALLQEILEQPIVNQNAIVALIRNSDRETKNHIQNQPKSSTVQVYCFNPFRVASQVTVADLDNTATVTNTDVAAPVKQNENLDEVAATPKSQSEISSDKIQNDAEADPAVPITHTESAVVTDDVTAARKSHSEISSDIIQNAAEADSAVPDTHNETNVVTDDVAAARKSHSEISSDIILNDAEADPAVPVPVTLNENASTIVNSSTIMKWLENVGTINGPGYKYSNYESTGPTYCSNKRKNDFDYEERGNNLHLD